MITITTVTEGNGTVLSKLLVDIEVDFFRCLWAPRDSRAVVAARMRRIIVDSVTARTRKACAQCGFA